MKQYSIIPECNYYFCTDTIWGWQSVLASEPFFQTMIDSLKYCRENNGLQIHGFVIMPNHVHTILSTEKKSLSSILRDYKRFTSNRISVLLRESNNKRLLNYFSTAEKEITRGDECTIWQRGSRPSGLITKKFFQQKLNYIHLNPVRKGYVLAPEHWKYSSARNYILNDQSILEIDLIGGE